MSNTSVESDGMDNIGKCVGSYIYIYIYIFFFFLNAWHSLVNRHYICFCHKTDDHMVHRLSDVLLECPKTSHNIIITKSSSGKMSHNIPQGGQGDVGSVLGASKDQKCYLPCKRWKVLKIRRLLIKTTKIHCRDYGHIGGGHNIVH